MLASCEIGTGNYPYYGSGFDGDDRVRVRVCVLRNGSYAGASAACAMVPILVMFSLLGYDDQNGWLRYRAALPLARRDIVVRALLSDRCLFVGYVGCPVCGHHGMRFSVSCFGDRDGADFDA